MSGVEPFGKVPKPNHGQRNLGKVSKPNRGQKMYKKEKNKMAFFPRSKKGYYFSLDALMALVIIIGVVILIKPQPPQIHYEPNVHEDLLSVLSSLKIGDINNSYVKSLIASGNITNLNQSVLEQIGDFYANSDSRYQTLSQNILDGLNLKENVGIYFNNQEIARTGNLSLDWGSAGTVTTSRQIISGVQAGGSATGFSSRAFLFSQNKVEYFYFGGYVGDGNLTVKFDGDIIGAKVEGVFSRNFDLYINNQLTQSHSPTAGVPYKIDLNPYLGLFVSGENLIRLNSSTGNLYAAGGFIKVVYNEVQNVTTASIKKFPGVDGLINLYDSIYVPGNLTNMEVFLHYNSSFDLFMTIGNKTVYNGNSSGNVITATIPNSTLSSILDYQSISRKTIPMRLAIKNLGFFGNAKPLDIISVTDLSGSMGGQKIIDARNANTLLVDTILGFDKNKIGLVGYDTWARSSDFHTLSNDSNSLKNKINSFSANGFTCICCGVLKAINCFDKNIFLDNFNDQTTESVPTRWSVTEGNGRVRIIAPGLEGSQAVNISRLLSQNPVMNHYFAPQEDKITVEFLAGHKSGSGRVKIIIGGANSGFSDFQSYIIIKMYSGWIRNNDAQVVSYNVGQTYKIKVEVLPGSSTYDLYVDDNLVGNDLAVFLTRNNVARVLFTTENSAVNYILDDLKVFLTNEICTLPADTNNRTRVAIVMSDGQANRACGLDPVIDHDGDGDTSDDEEDHAIEAACRAYNNYNITTYAVGFGIGANEATLQAIASCGNGNYYFSDVTNLVQVYAQIAQDILNLTFAEQTATGNILTKLYPDSYVSLKYQKNIPTGLIVTAETPEFGNTISEGIFSVPGNSIPFEAGVVSYSGAKWTDNLEVYNNATGIWERVFNLSAYNNTYSQLGDPYIVNVPSEKLVIGENRVRISTGLNSTSSLGGSIHNKAIYSVIKNLSSYTQIVASAQGCIWTIEFEDGSNSTLNIPTSYAGVNACSYTSSSIAYNNNDAIQLSTIDLLTSLDLDSDGRVEIKFDESDLTIDSIEITGIPFTWETEVQVRVWR